MFEGIKAIYFDLDNTLIDRDAALIACIKDFFDAYLPHYYFDNEQYLIEENDYSGYTPREEFCEWFLQQYQPQGWDEASFWNYMLTNISNYVPKLSPQLQNKLLTLEKNYTLGVITNGTISSQSRKIQKSGLHTILSPQAINISQQYQMQKPEKKFFLLVLEGLAIKPNEMLFVGEDPVNDILGAANVGIKTCWLSHNREWEQDIKPDYIIDNINALPSS